MTGPSKRCGWTIINFGFTMNERHFMNGYLQLVSNRWSAYVDMQGMVTVVLARLGGKHDAWSQIGVQMSWNKKQISDTISSRSGINTFSHSSLRGRNSKQKFYLETYIYVSKLCQEHRLDCSSSICKLFARLNFTQALQLIYHNIYPRAKFYGTLKC